MLETTESMSGGSADLIIVKGAVVVVAVGVALKRHVLNVTQQEGLRL